MHEDRRVVHLRASHAGPWAVDRCLRPRSPCVSTRESERCVSDPGCLSPDKDPSQDPVASRPRPHDRPVRFRERGDRRTTLSRHPGSSSVLCRGGGARTDAPVFRSRGAHARDDPRLREERLEHELVLGPRSLGPPLFLERCVRAYSRPGDGLSAAATSETYGHDPSSRFLAGTKASTFFLF